MSCFIMLPDSLAALGNATAVRLNLHFDFWGFGAPEELYDAFADCRIPAVSDSYSAQAIYDKLYALNVKAYCQRYKDSVDPEDTVKPDVNVTQYAICRNPTHPFTPQPWHYQLAQLLDCYLYQTAEQATYNDPVRLAMKEFRNKLYEFIVLKSPQYAAFRWGKLAPSYLRNQLEHPAQQTKWIYDGHMEAMRQAVFETAAINKMGGLRREYAATLYLLTGMEDVWLRIKHCVSRNGIDYEEMLEEPLSSGERLIVGLAGNLFNGASYIHFTPMDLIDRLDDDMLKLAINGIALRRSNLPIVMLGELSA